MHDREFTPTDSRLSGLRSAEDVPEQAAGARRSSPARADQLVRAAMQASTEAAPPSVRGLSAQTSRAMRQIQRQQGNRYVQRVVLARKGDGPAEVEPGVEQAIQRERGGGQALDRGVRSSMESALGADFAAVRVHTGVQADSLSRSLNARAFTTGQDIFFRAGAYDPGSSNGRELMAHELTHVVQQGGGSIQRKLTVNEPGDRFEQEADQVARAVTLREQQPAPAPVAAVSRQAEGDEDKAQTKVDTAAIQRQAKEDEDKVQAKVDAGEIQRQAEEEEEAG